MQIDLGTLVVIVALGAASPLIVDVVPRIVLPVVVVEILLGIVVGPPVLGWIHVTGLAQVLADFGLAFLFFLAGFELDLNQLQGVPARLALTGWRWRWSWQGCWSRTTCSRAPCSGEWR